MPTIGPDHLIFVDFENVPTVDLELVATHPAHVTLLIGKNQKKLDIALVQQIHRLGERIALIPVGASGHNALDLTLAYHLGQSARQTPLAKFYIVSKDTDFDPLIAHIRSTGVAVLRHASFASLPFLPRPKKPAAAAATPPVNRRTKLIMRLTDPSYLSHPTTEKALLAHIKTTLGKESTDEAVQSVIRELTELRSLTIDATTRKVTYAAAVAKAAAG